MILDVGEASAAGGVSNLPGPAPESAEGDVPEAPFSRKSLERLDALCVASLQTWPV